jgi:hypothetical protein
MLIGLSFIASVSTAGFHRSPHLQLPHASLSHCAPSRFDCAAVPEPEIVASQAVPHIAAKNARPVPGDFIWRIRFLVTGGGGR